MGQDDKKEEPHLLVVDIVEDDDEEETYERMSVIDIVGTPDATPEPSKPADENAAKAQEHLSRWLLAFSTGDYQGAIEAAYDAVWALPDDHSVRCKLATAFMMAGQYPQAAEALEYILEREPEHEEARSLADSREILGHLMKEAREHLKNRDFGSALIPVKRAIKFVPTYAEPYVLRAIISYQHGRRQECIADLKLALEQDPQHEQARKLLEELDKG